MQAFFVPGYNDYAKELHCEARTAYIAWKRAGRPRTRVFCSDMRTSRFCFKYTLRLCKRNELSMRANAHAKSLLDKGMVSFWKGIRKENNSRVPITAMVDDCVGEKDICAMWQTHYESLLNGVGDRSHDGVTADFENLSDVITLTPADIISGFKSLKLGKASGVHCLAAEHFLYAHDFLYPILSILLTSFITHGYFPADFMKTALVSIIKNKTGDTGDKNNYKPIALVTAASKFFEICLLEILEMYLITHDHQFEFKSKHSADMCIFSAKSIMKCYTNMVVLYLHVFLTHLKHLIELITGHFSGR